MVKRVSLFNFVILKFGLRANQRAYPLLGKTALLVTSAAHNYTRPS